MVVVVDGLAASGGYIAALASDRIFAQQSSIVGSIGVIFQYPNFTDLLKTIGVKVETSNPRRSRPRPNGFEPTSPEARAARRGDGQGFRMTGSRIWCASGRSLDQAALDKVADGRVFTGRQALELKLIDALGDEKSGGRLARQGEGDRRQDAGARLPAQPAVRRPAVPAHRDGRHCSMRLGFDGLARTDQGMGRIAGGRAAQP